MTCKKDTNDKFSPTFHLCNNPPRQTYLQRSVITVIIEREREKNAEYIFEVRATSRRILANFTVLQGVILAASLRRIFLWQDLSAGLSPVEDAKTRTWFHFAGNYKYVARASPWDKRRMFDRKSRPDRWRISPRRVDYFFFLYDGILYKAEFVKLSIQSVIAFLWLLNANWFINWASWDISSSSHLH